MNLDLVAIVLYAITFWSLQVDIRDLRNTDTPEIRSVIVPNTRTTSLRQHKQVS
jgi:hypothetical protein